MQKTLGFFENLAAIFRPSNNTWCIRQSSDGQVRYESRGVSTDKFVPADYDRDGKTDLAVFRGGIWYIRQSSANGNAVRIFRARFRYARPGGLRRRRQN